VNPHGYLAIYRGRWVWVLPEPPRVSKPVHSVCLVIEFGRFSHTLIAARSELQT
jgi:hypothetical protein